MPDQIDLMTPAHEQVCPSLSVSRRSQDQKKPKGIEVERFFTKEDCDPFDDAGPWIRRDAVIRSADGSIVFIQKAVEVPESWSQLATNVVAQKYFRGILGAPDREDSIRTLITRVADTITDWGQSDGYFRDPWARDSFRADLVHLLVTQKAAFNSPPRVKLVPIPM